MTPDRLFDLFKKHLDMLEQKWTALEDRVDVLEENTSNWDCRIEDLEEWQVKVDDYIDNDYIDNDYG